MEQPRLVSAIVDALIDNDVVVREHAADALEKLRRHMPNSHDIESCSQSLGARPNGTASVHATDIGSKLSST